MKNYFHVLKPFCKTQSIIATMEDTSSIHNLGSQIEKHQWHQSDNYKQATKTSKIHSIHLVLPMVNIKMGYMGTICKN